MKNINRSPDARAYVKFYKLILAIFERKITPGRAQAQIEIPPRILVSPST